jgi:chemotaxis protein MotB
MSGDSKKLQPIIIKRVKKGGHAVHGGAWKIAYADFVTAMMAFFMVMWIVGMDEHTKKAIEGYFTNPVGYKKGYGSGSSPLANGASPTQVADAHLQTMLRQFEEKSFKNAADNIKARLDSARGQLGNARFEVTVTASGLRIELLEDGSGEKFFTRGSADVKSSAEIGLTVIAHELVMLRNPVVVEGHTDATTYNGGNSHYTNWELSSDRANAARRILEEAGLNPARIAEVRGFADTKPRNADDPYAAENRRISILLPFTTFRTDATPQTPAIQTP